MCDTNKNVTKMGVIIKGFTEVCFDMIEWHHVNKGNGLVISTTSSIMAFNEQYLTSITTTAKLIIVVNIVHGWLALTKAFLCETTSFFTIGCRQPICNTWCALEIKQKNSLQKDYGKNGLNGS
jgi:hypothetical protein